MYFSNRKIISFFASILALTLSSQAYSHGYSEQPKTRQQKCVDDGGYWWPDDGSAIPNAACRAAFLESGTFQFVQNIEFAANVTDYENLDAVKAVVTDGLLCAAGDSAKRGMDVPSNEWQKTDITLDANGEFEFSFFGATPHNPSYWEFYLTKPTFDAATQVLTWADLELVDQKGNIPISQVNGRNMYQMKVKIPAGREGDAILYTRWQRRDVAGEGFYNCSDITIKSNGTPTEWFDKGYFVSQGDEAQVNDEIWFRVFNQSGSELIFEKLAIDATNQQQSQWAETIATQVNATHPNIAKIGIRSASDGTISYDPSNTLSNKVWLKNIQNSFTLDIKKPVTNQPPLISLPTQHQTNAGLAIDINVDASDPESQPLTYSWNVPAPLAATNNDQATVSINAHSPSQTSDYSISVDVSDGVNTVSAATTLTIIVEAPGCIRTDPDAVNHPAWQASQTYQANTTVSHQQLVWKANWWNQSSEPSLANDAWKLLSNVELDWQPGTAFNGGEEVDHKNRRWKAKWWTNLEPGVSSDWEDIGPAKCTN